MFLKELKQKGGGRKKGENCVKRKVESQGRGTEEGRRREGPAEATSLLA